VQHAARILMPSCRLHPTKTHLALFHTQGFEDREEQARVQEQAGFLPRTQEAPSVTPSCFVRRISRTGRSRRGCRRRRRS